MSSPPPPPAVLVSNGAVSPHAPPSAATFLESTAGAYTTARASPTGGLLWWPRHLLRLADSARRLAETHPHLLGLPGPPPHALSASPIAPLVNRSVRVGVHEMRRLGDRGSEDLAITALVRADGSPEGLEVCVHLGLYVPPVFGVAGARLAVAGGGREAAAAKYAPWARMRKAMEKMRPPGTTELLLTNDGDRLLEGSVTNFFVVCRKEEHLSSEPLSVQAMSNEIEVQTAPLSDGVLPGIMRQIVIEVCHDLGIPVGEVSPSWSKRELWEEAFVTSSLRLIQHVETIQVPSVWEDIDSKTWNDVSWVVKQFQGAGCITTQIQRKISERAIMEEYNIANLCEL